MPCSPLESLRSGSPGRRSVAVELGGTVTLSAIFPPARLHSTAILPYMPSTCAFTWLSCGTNAGAISTSLNARAAGSGVAAGPPSGRRMP